MAELALDEVQQHALELELELARVRVAQPVWRERRRTPALAATRRNSLRTAVAHRVPEEELKTGAAYARRCCA